MSNRKPQGLDIVDGKLVPDSWKEVPMTISKITIHVNNKGLKKLFPKTVITKKKIAIGEINIPFLIQAIKSQGRTDYTNFQLVLDKEERAVFELEGEYNSWTLGVKIKVY